MQRNKGDTKMAFAPEMAQLAALARGNFPKDEIMTRIMQDIRKRAEGGFNDLTYDTSHLQQLFGNYFLFGDNVQKCGITNCGK